MFLFDGPKLKASPFNFLFFDNFIDKIKYPDNASKTCCHGLVELGFLNWTFLFFDHDFTQSDINLSDDQSPPPITFPALATAKEIFFFELKKEFIYVWIINSAAALEEL